MLWSNTQEFCLNLWSICKVLCSTNSTFYFSYPTLITKLYVSSFSTVQYTINNSSPYVYKHFKFNFVAFITLVNAYFGKIISTDSSKSHKSCVKMYFMQILSIVWAILPISYAGIMFNAFAFLLWSKLHWHNKLKPKIYW